MNTFIYCLVGFICFGIAFNTVASIWMLVYQIRRGDFTFGDFLAGRVLPNLD